jgi:hypothetical protein
MLHQRSLGGSNKQEEMGRKCSIHGKQEMYTQFCSENLKGTGTQKTKVQIGDNIRMDLRNIGWESVNWMHLAQKRDQW